jgi:hypothetical protein
MQDLIQNVDRFLAAHESGAGKYPADVMDFLASRLTEFKRCPEMGLDDAFGIQIPERNERMQLRDRYLREHFLEFESPLAKSCQRAARDIEENFIWWRKDRDDPNIPPQYRLLFDRVWRLQVRLPSDEMLRKILGNC